MWWMRGLIGRRHTHAVCAPPWGAVTHVFLAKVGEAIERALVGLPSSLELGPLAALAVHESVVAARREHAHCGIVHCFKR